MQMRGKSEPVDIQKRIVFIGVPFVYIDLENKVLAFESGPYLD